jgi:amidohydrolase
MKTKATPPIRAAAPRITSDGTPKAQGSIEMKPTIVAGSSGVRAAIAREMPDLLAFRHDLHKHPELSFQEKRTGQVVQRELAKLGIRFKAGLGGGTGVVGFLPATVKGREKHGSIALRADMDALPIIEQTGVPYASIHPGVMHACGHDGHTAMLLGAAKVLCTMERPNNITLVFQPAEENEGGGKLMCQEGMLDGDKGAGIGPGVARIYGMHGWPQLPLGQIASRPGPLMAAVDDFIVTIRGVQSHGAYPHLSRDPIVTTAHIITALQTIASRNVSPLDAVVVTVGQIEGGTANNIIPEGVRIIGTVRTLRDETKTIARERFHDIVTQTAAAHGCTASIDYHDGYPVTSNDKAEFAKVISLAREVVGERNAIHLDNPTMGGEDFSFYGRHVPSCFFFLGLRPVSAGDDYPSLHQPGFDFNDEAMPLGIEMFVRLATQGE